MSGALPVQAPLTLFVPFHQLLAVSQVPLPSDGFGAVAPFASHVSVAACVSPMARHITTTIAKQSRRGARLMARSEIIQLVTTKLGSRALTILLQGRGTQYPRKRGVASPSSPRL